MFWSGRAPAADRPPWRCSAMSANWRAATRKFSGVPSLIPPGTLKLQPEDEIDVPFYVRFVVKDRAGIVGDIGKTFGRIGVNISEIWQLRHVEEELRSLTQSYQLKQKSSEILPFVMTLERATLRQMRRALDSIRNRDYILVDPVWFPIWDSYTTLSFHVTSSTFLNGCESFAADEIHHSSRRRHGRLSARSSGRQNAFGSGAHAEHGLARRSTACSASPM